MVQLEAIINKINIIAAYTLIAVCDENVIEDFYTDLSKKLTILKVETLI